MNVWNIAIGPAICDFRELDLYHLLTLFSQVPKYSLSSSVVLEHKQDRIGVVVKPDLDAYVLE